MKNKVEYDPYSDWESVKSNYLTFREEMRMLQKMEKYLSSHEDLEWEEPEEDRNQDLLDDLDEWTMFCWKEWTCIEARMSEMRERFPKLEEEVCPDDS